MKKTIFAAFLVMLLVPLVAFAASSKGEEFVLPPAESHEGDLLKAAAKIRIEGTVTGDALIAAGESTVNGTVLGDVLVAGGSVKVSGIVGQDLRVGGGNVEVSADIGRNLTVFGGNVRLAEETEISGNVNVFGGDVVIKGVLAGDVRVFGGKVSVEGAVLGNLIVYSEDIEVLAGTSVGRDFTYYTNGHAFISDSVQITGETVVKPLPKINKFDRSFGKSFAFAGALISFFAALILALIIWHLVPGPSRRIIEGSKSHFWKKFLWGLLTFIVVPIASLIALITIIGIPLAFAGMASYVLILVFGYIYGLLMFGNFLLGLGKKDLPQGNKFPWSVFVVGAVVLIVIKLVPIIGGVVMLVVLLWGIGSLMLAKKMYLEQFKKAADQPPPQPLL